MANLDSMVVENNVDNVVLEDSDVLDVIDIDEEDLPDAEDGVSDGETIGEVDDSLQAFLNHDDEIFAIVCSPLDPTLVASGGKDNKGFLWNIGHTDNFLELGGHKDSVSTVAFNSDGKLVASGGLDGLLQIWDAFSGHLKCSSNSFGPISRVCWHPNENITLVICEDPTFAVMNADNSFCSFFASDANLTCGDFTPDGSLICIGTCKGTMRMVDPSSGEDIRVVKGHGFHSHALSCLTIRSDSTIAVTGSEDGSICLANIKNGKVLASLKSHESSIECLSYSPSFPWFASGGLDGKLIIWDSQHLQSRCTCDLKSEVICIAWLGTSRYIAAGCMDGTVQVWDSLTGNCIKSLGGHSGPIQAMAVTSDSSFLVSASLDGSARVFSIAEFQ